MSMSIRDIKKWREFYGAEKIRYHGRMQILRSKFLYGTINIPYSGHEMVE